jgi:EmrB/QacA subfamily drug resistance transporter
MNALSPRRRVLVWTAVVSGLLLAMLDQTIVGTALPEIVADLGGPDWYVWAFTAYLVPATVLLPVVARLSDRFGRQRVLLTGMTLFVTGSSVCGLATVMPVLAAGRAMQGSGAAALEAVSFVLVSEMSGTARRGVGQAAISMVMAISFVAGPLIGGLLTDHAGWRWAFLVNVPIGLAAMALLVSALPPSFGRHESRRTPVDVLGVVLLTAGVGAVLVGINRHQQLGTWTAPSAGPAILLGLLGLAAFLRVERYAAAPIIPLRLFTDRVSGRLLLTGAFATTGLYACVLLVPRWYQVTEHTSATGSGVRVYPLLLALLVGVNVGAIVVVRRSEVRGPLLVAGAVTIGGAAAFATLDDGSAAWLPLVAMALLGLGMGPALSGLQIAIARTTAPADLGAAMGTLLLGRQVVGVVALAVTDAVYHAGLAGGSPTEATGSAVAAVAGVGALVAAVALLRLPRRLPEPPYAVAAAVMSPSTEGTK